MIDRFKHKSSDYFAGYMSALEEVFAELSSMHHDPEKYDRKVIDQVWERVKKKEHDARGIASE